MMNCRLAVNCLIRMAGYRLLFRSYISWFMIIAIERIWPQASPYKHQCHLGELQDCLQSVIVTLPDLIFPSNAPDMTSNLSPLAPAMSSATAEIPASVSSRILEVVVSGRSCCCWCGCCCGCCWGGCGERFNTRCSVNCVNFRLICRRIFFFFSCFSMIRPNSKQCYESYWLRSSSSSAMGSKISAL